MMFPYRVKSDSTKLPIKAQSLSGKDGKYTYECGGGIERQRLKPAVETVLSACAAGPD
jgi:hypothetical protein